MLGAWQRGSCWSTTRRWSAAACGGFLVAVLLALLPSLWFGRFDPARAGAAGREDTAPLPPGPDVAPVDAAGFALPRTPSEHGGAFGRLLGGEVRILFSGVSRWWWLGAAGLTLAALLVPKASVTVAVLPALWVWPVLIWSRLGSRQTENGLEGLLGSYPSAHRRLLAEYGSGVVLTALMGAAPLVRIVAAGDSGGLTAWFVGVLFVPSLALFLGVLCRTPRVFQALYLPLWYLVLNGVAGLDFMGAVRERGEPAGPLPLFTAASVLLLTASVLIAAVRRNVKA
ncbi:hypothetical protein DSC45_27475 [Streptomyces sp. YIM 130001]|uniref:hypothetical protein n=1 Tax=Streptomyces sp. YIM 130001 TaxID=2259644 RepID=UPI000E653A09|nr:hypothetical protein [Streptomyces sp. YIM 130001]RII12034.1 hypothetical protein DSC45_27475 [Streptomyces sp. YIM 130001]